MRNGSQGRDSGDSTSETASSPDCCPDSLVTDLKIIAARISQYEAPADAFDPWDMRPWVDMAGMALIAEEGGLRANCERALSDGVEEHLGEVLGERTPEYFVDLVHCARVLRVLSLEDKDWQVVSQDSELLGATQRETFPAMCAVWLKEPPPVTNASVRSPELIPVRLEFLRLLHLLEPESWYPYQALGILASAAAARSGVRLEVNDVIDGKDLAERILLPLGAVNINRDRNHFSLQVGLTIPALPGVSDPCQQEKAKAFRDTIRDKLAKNQSWRRVATGLLRCIEIRRQRDAYADSVRCLDPEGHHLETDSRIPFRDCLFLAKLGRLTRPRSVPSARMHPGQFVFRLDGDRIRRRVEEGLPVEAIAEFLAERCEEDDYERCKQLIERAVPGARLSR